MSRSTDKHLAAWRAPPSNAFFRRLLQILRFPRNEKRRTPRRNLQCALYMHARHTRDPALNFLYRNCCSSSWRAQSNLINPPHTHLLLCLDALSHVITAYHVLSGKWTGRVLLILVSDVLRVSS